MAVVDATIVESAGRPRRHVEVMAEDRAEGAAPEMPVTERLSADPDSRRLKKGSRCFFDYKGFIRTDGDGYVERVLAQPATEGKLRTSRRWWRLHGTAGAGGQRSGQRRQPGALGRGRLKSGIM